MLQANINGLLRGNFGQNNTVIEPGDIINIPPTDVFFVAGEVRSPGSYPLKDGTTLRQAISLAQGTTFRAKSSKGVIFREDQKTGRRQEIPVDISAVMSGKQPDIPIRANDIVIVPNSTFKSVGSTILTAFGVNSARLPFYY
jgi:protein involved in polysaccharide export with SLBB domain